MAVSIRGLIRDWVDETQALEADLSPLSPEDWELATPAPGWDIRHQVAHLTWTDEALALALCSPDEFDALRNRVLADPEGVVNEAAASGATKAPEVIMRRWVSGQRRAAEILEGSDPSSRMPWFGPPMGAAAAISARIMETFAHGQDIRDALGLKPPRSSRLRHIAHLAVAARGYSFKVNGLPVPPDEIRVELTFEGETWSWGPEHATQRVIGDALEFALLATRRRHIDDVSLKTTGEVAETWANLAQAYAGPPGHGREPLSSSSTKIS
ncbi:TIGR03084 family metal-binding protein [Pseudarthrobacter sp. NBSH8]|uniref:TIGR03084 family metal-binding protein n=1 Tax=Pseudarthrobacter sp. NBSH8 TaxID=2596911 RepID=UPI001624C3B6|nr:TIGR03084 family metal-binding protein [Pseudarthrobacter sp. NBSH8]QNE14379.1 TIGR03084 family protein [Pseudarthrobacter sp. NBSH8]